MNGTGPSGTPKYSQSRASASNLTARLTPLRIPVIASADNFVSRTAARREIVRPSRFSLASHKAATTAVSMLIMCGNSSTPESVGQDLDSARVIRYNEQEIRTGHGGAINTTAALINTTQSVVMTAQNYLILSRELANEEFRRQHTERREYRETFAALPEVPTGTTYSTLTVEPDCWQGGNLLLRITIGDECHTRSVSVSDVDAVRRYADQFRMVNLTSRAQEATA